MRILDLFVVASMPILKVLLVTVLGSFLALDCIDVLGENAMKQLNNVVFFVFNPALVSSNLAKTVTLDSIVMLWFMPFNILMTFVLGTAIGWVLIKTTKAPQHLRGLILSCCAAGNVGHIPLIVVPAICAEKGPFGAPDICHTYGMAIGAVYLWSFVYNIIRVSSAKINNGVNGDNSTRVIKSNSPGGSPLPTSRIRFRQGLAFVGFAIGLVPQTRNLVIGGNAPLHVVQESAYLLGDAAIPIVTLIVGGNLKRFERTSWYQQVTGDRSNRFPVCYPPISGHCHHKDCSLVRCGALGFIISVHSSAALPMGVDRGSQTNKMMPEKFPLRSRRATINKSGKRGKLTSFVKNMKMNELEMIRKNINANHFMPTEPSTTRET
ncbi:Auxin:hydrogen symporter, putative isoform 2 [Hibiscus syriacus]|uniref:Auxin:hydrogen symporter, putative isoform 2 n=1 Tax=Hibiscus syriacus TaxID=106335 RepID=A0A6A3C493_HIBSY|nr:Auxin:hydrogen symporter, putative isoform 2 [Hibiscus syriacus]